MNRDGVVNRESGKEDENRCRDRDIQIHAVPGQFSTFIHTLKSSSDIPSSMCQ